MNSTKRIISLETTACGLTVLLAICATTTAPEAQATYPRTSQIQPGSVEVVVADFATAPLSSRTRREYPPPIDVTDQLGRIGMLRSEPADAPLSAARLFVSDLNRTLYILDKTTRAFTEYINFEEVFQGFANRTSHGAGFGSFVFDPAYARNGRFYTVHAEAVLPPAQAAPRNRNLPGLDMSAGYVTTRPFNPDGTVVRHSVLLEWTDTNVANARFEGSVRELLRIGFNNNAHPLADMLFSPTARPGDNDYGNLYVAVGNGYSSVLPPRLDSLIGKMLRITPDVTLRPDDELSTNGRYRIPTTGADPNPFVGSSLAGVKKEIYAYGLRNPQRISWDPASNTMFVVDIGEGAWEEVNILKKGAHYGFPVREGHEVLIADGPDAFRAGSQMTPARSRPVPDVVSVAGLASAVTPVYPVAVYGHGDGDAIAGGLVYRGTRIPLLSGKYIFGDISTGRLFAADASDLLAADDGNPDSVAKIQELPVVFDSPYDSPDRGLIPRRLFDVVKDAYAQRGGRVSDGSALPGAATQHITNGKDADGVPYGRGRADIRLAADADGELYILSKSDGMIRALVSARPRMESRQN